MADIIKHTKFRVLTNDEDFDVISFANSEENITMPNGKTFKDIRIEMENANRTNLDKDNQISSNLKDGDFLFYFMVDPKTGEYGFKDNSGYFHPM